MKEDEEDKLSIEVRETSLQEFKLVQYLEEQKGKKKELERKKIVVLEAKVKSFQETYKLWIEV